MPTKTKVAAVKKPVKRRSTKKAPSKPKRSLLSGLKLRHAGGLAVLAVGAIWGGSVLLSQPAPLAPGANQDHVPPSLALAKPLRDTTESGGMNIVGIATDNTKVQAVTLRIDDTHIETDQTSPYTFRLDTSKYSNGRHTVTLRAFDSSDNMGESETVTVTFKNQGAPGATSSPTKGSTTAITAGGGARTAAKAPVAPANRTVLVSPATAGNAVKVWVNGKLIDTNYIHAINLTNGVHTIAVEEEGVISYRKISVSNPISIAALNNVRANVGTYAVFSGLILALAAVYIFKPYAFGLSSNRECALTKRQRTNYKR